MMVLLVNFLYCWLNQSEVEGGIAEHLAPLNDRVNSLASIDGQLKSNPIRNSE